MNLHPLSSKILKNLEKGDCRLILHPCTLSHKFICLVSIPSHTLKDWAVKFDDILFALDPRALEERDSAELSVVESYEIRERIPRNSMVLPYDALYHKYGNDPALQKLFINNGGRPFTDIERIKLLGRIITHNLQISNAAIPRNGIVSSCFPLHKPAVGRKLLAKWMSYRLWPAVSLIHRLRDYAGDSFAMATSFFHIHLTSWLLFPILWDAVMVIESLVRKDNFFKCTAVTAAVAPLLLPFWGIIMLKIWMRQQSKLACKFGTIHHSNDAMRQPVETAQADFALALGSELARPVDPASLHRPWESCRKSLGKSTSATLAICLCIIGCITCAHIAMYQLATFDVFSDQTVFFILIFFALVLAMMTSEEFSKLAVRLTAMEHHSCQEDHEASLLMKLFAFEFVSYVVPVLFTALLQKYTEKSISFVSSQIAVRIHAGIVLLVYLIKDFFGSFVRVYASYWFALRRVQAAHKQNQAHENKFFKITQAELESVLLKEEPSTIETLRWRLRKLMLLQMICLFSSFLPLASLALFLYWYMDSKSAVWKMINLSQRPIPKSCENVGAHWMAALRAVLFIAAFINPLTSVIAYDTLGLATSDSKMVFLLLFYVHYAWAGSCLDYFFSDEPDKVHLHVHWSKYLLERLVDGDDRQSCEHGDEGGDGPTRSVGP